MAFVALLKSVRKCNPGHGSLLFRGASTCVLCKSNIDSVRARTPRIGSIFDLHDLRPETSLYRVWKS